MFYCDLINNEYYLKSNNKFITHNSNKLIVSHSIIDLDDCITLEPVNNIYFTLKLGNSYLNEDLKICRLNNRIKLQWMDSGIKARSLINYSQSVIYDRSYKQLDYVSVDGINLLTQNNFTLILEGNWKDKLVNNKNQFKYCQFIKTNIKFKLILKGKDILIYCPAYGYLGYDTHLENIRYFKELPNYPIKLAKAEIESFYRLKFNDSFVRINWVCSTTSNCELVKDSSLSSVFQFLAN